jgi:hypothetical protein
VTEHDPTGRDQHEPGAKLDAGKPRPALVLGGFVHALKAVTEVGTFGAAKYTDNGWRTVPDGPQRYTDAMLRHWLADPGGLSSDPDSGLAHAAHLAWNALARLELMLAEKRKLQAMLGEALGQSNAERAERSRRRAPDAGLGPLPTRELADRLPKLGQIDWSRVGPLL